MQHRLHGEAGIQAENGLVELEVVGFEVMALHTFTKSNDRLDFLDLTKCKKCNQHSKKYDGRKGYDGCDQAERNTVRDTHLRNDQRRDRRSQQVRNGDTDNGSDQSQSQEHHQDRTLDVAAGVADGLQSTDGLHVFLDIVADAVDDHENDDNDDKHGYGEKRTRNDQRHKCTGTEVHGDRL